MQLLYLIGLVSTISALMAQATQAQITQVTGVQTNPTSIDITGTLSASYAATRKQEILSSAAQLTARQQNSPTPQPRLGQKKPTKSAQLLVQKPVSTPASGKVVQVTGVRLSTRDGLSVFLETADGQQLPAASTRSEGNTLIADIPKAVLALPSGKDFRADNPVTGITTVTVTGLDGNRIRVLVTGTTVPTAEVVPSQSGLVLILTRQTDTTTVQTTPETPADEQADELQVETDVNEVPQTPSQQPTAEGKQPIEVTVTATRTEEQTQDVPRSVTVINREQIEQQTRLSRDLGEILGKTVPGLAPPTQSASNFGQTLRGRNILVLIDGVPQSTSRNAFRDLKTIDPAANGTKKSRNTCGLSPVAIACSLRAGALSSMGKPLSGVYGLVLHSVLGVHRTAL